MRFDDNIIRVCKNMKLKISYLKHKNLSYTKVVLPHPYRKRLKEKHKRIAKELKEKLHKG